MKAGTPFGMPAFKGGMRAYDARRDDGERLGLDFAASKIGGLEGHIRS